MKDVMKTLHFEDRDLPLAFTLNVMEAIQDEYGTLDNWIDLTSGTEGQEVNIKALLFGMTEMLNEGGEISAEEKAGKFTPYTKKQVGRILTAYGMENALARMQETVIESTQSGEKNE